MVTSLDTNDSIVKSVTKEILDEINMSEKVFTTEEIKKKISERLNEIFSSTPEKVDENQIKKENEIENRIEEDFKEIEDEDDLSSLLSMKEKSEEPENLSNVDTLQSVNSEVLELPKEKKSFFLEISDLYKEELQNSIGCFKNVIDSLKIMKGSSFIEIFLIFLILIIPAFLGGIATLAVLVIILLFWQLYILLYVLIKWLKKIEDSIKSSISSIRKKIVDMKANGGWFYRLLFSNALYSIIMFNGIFYMLIKGMMLPLQSLAAIDKMLANFVSKSANIITTTLRGPSELALNNFRTDAIKSSNKVAGKAQTQGSQSRLKTPERPAAKGKQQEIGRDMSRKVEAAKQAVATADRQSQRPFTEGPRLGQAVANSEQFKNMSATLAAAGISGATSPNSAKLSESARTEARGEGLATSIMASVMEGMVAKAMQNGQDLSVLPSAMSSVGSNLTDLRMGLTDPRIERNISQERAEKMGEITNSTSNLESLGMKDIDKALQMYNDGASSNFEKILEASIPNWNDMSFREQVSAAVEFGSLRAGLDDIDDVKQFESWGKENPSARFGDFLDYKVAEAQADMQTEKAEFATRYGANCDELIKDQMVKDGYNPEHVLSDREFLDVASRAVENFPPDNRLAAAKDLSEYHDTWVELQRCQQEATTEKGREASEGQRSFVDTERERFSERSDMSIGIN